MYIVQLSFVYAGKLINPQAKGTTRSKIKYYLCWWSFAFMLVELCRIKVKLAVLRGAPERVCVTARDFGLDMYMLGENSKSFAGLMSFHTCW